jgi:hypothetical protein
MQTYHMPYVVGLRLQRPFEELLGGYVVMD